MTLGDRLKELINRSHYSRTDIADKVNISKQTLYKYENNIVTNIPSDKIELLSKVLNTSPAYLMGWEDNENYQAIAQMQSDTIAYEDRIINQMKDQLDDLSIDSLATLNDILKLNLSPPEWSDLEKYAEFICSKRK